MTRLLISLEESDRRWLEQRSRETGASMSAVVRHAIRQAQENGRKSMKDQLASTRGVWLEGDGLRYQRPIRKEWR